VTEDANPPVGQLANWPESEPLSPASLPALKAHGIPLPEYDRARTQTGVVHFGPGAFHRVHQAFYFDAALARDPRWGICEVALQSPGVRDALAPQQGLYSLAILDAVSNWRVIGSIRELLVARETPATVLERLVAPTTRLVTATITEKGYCLTADGGLDQAHPDIRHDLAIPGQPVSFVGYLVEGLRRRRERGVNAPTVLSCDNLTSNGKRLRRAVTEFAALRDADLARWIGAEVAFPCTMVDSITPATDDALRARAASELGVTDRWPVQREAFTQWVIEDTGRGELPDWGAIGVTVTNDVAGFEHAKLRLLNGAHSSLAYLGTLAGHETVAQAMSDTALASFVERLMREDILPTVTAPLGLELPSYITAVLTRFRNPAIRHLLSQIAWDGSQKLPFRILGTLADARAAGRSLERLCVPLIAWFQFVRRRVRDDIRIVDPLADRLVAIANQCTGDAQHDVALFLALEPVFPRQIANDATIIAALVRAYGRNAVTGDH
jgi:fructuronate reductase